MAGSETKREPKCACGKKAGHDGKCNGDLQTGF